MKKFLSSVLSIVILLFCLASCDLRTPMSEAKVKNVYEEFVKMLNNDRTWTDEFVFVVGENRFEVKNGKKEYFCDEEQQEMLDELFESIWQLMLALEEKELGLSGYDLQGVGDMCMISLNTEKDTVFDYYSFCIHDDGKTQVTIRKNDEIIAEMYWMR
jgi:hypothetical protein